MVSIEGCKENFKRSQKVTIRYFILCGPFAIILCRRFDKERILNNRHLRMIWI